ncbi:MAG: hypothetical protein CMK07_15095 [Ponticaulis sp.]|nr:hypothetical protein [Ponticaulis sp.]
MANADTPLGHGADYAENFRLIDQNGESHELFYHKDKDAIVIMTAGNGCPIVRGAVPDLKQIREDYAEQNVQFFMLNSNLQDTREEIAAEAEEFGYDFAILKDENQLVGEQLNFDRTAQVYVINPKKGFKVEYYGPLNDRQTYERQRPTATETYVRDVLDAVIAGDEVTTEAPAIRAGCMVNFPERKKKGMTAEPISYSTDVAPILKEKCVECHQPGGIGPWSMTGGYQEIAGWAPMIRETIRTNRMPPWHADPAIGTFHGDRSLSGEEIKTIVHWVEDGAPRGEGEDPLVGLDLHAPDWPLGEPDLILTLPAYTVPATGVVDYVHPAIENPLTEDKWLKATTIKAGDRQSVHHVLSGYISDMPEDGLGTTDLWEFSTGGYAVGAESNVQAENTGVPFPAGGAIGFQVHYTPYGKEAEDVTQIGFYFQDKPELLNRTAVILDASIEIPPGEARHSETAYMEFPYDAILTSAFPHAHYRGYSSKLTVLYPDGREELVLNLPRYDFNWQRGYAWDEPLELPAGTKVIAEYVYDNSKANPANPDAGITVTWGDQSFEEMLYTSLTYRWKGETTDNLLAEQTRELEETRFFTALDDDIDGRLTEAELKGMLGQRMKANFERMDMNSDGAIDKQEYITINRLMRARGQQ